MTAVVDTVRRQTLKTTPSVLRCRQLGTHREDANLSERELCVCGRVTKSVATQHSRVVLQFSHAFSYILVNAATLAISTPIPSTVKWHLRRLVARNPSATHRSKW